MIIRDGGNGPIGSIIRQVNNGILSTKRAEQLLYGHEAYLVRRQNKYAAYLDNVKEDMSKINSDKVSIRDILISDALFVEYPQLEQLEIKMFYRPSKDGYITNGFHRGNVIALNSNKAANLDGVIIHEVMHHIQQLEHVPQGTNPEQAMKYINGMFGLIPKFLKSIGLLEKAAHAVYEANPGEIQARDVSGEFVSYKNAVDLQDRNKAKTERRVRSIIEQTLKENGVPNAHQVCWEIPEIETRRVICWCIQQVQVRSKYKTTGQHIIQINIGSVLFYQKIISTIRAYGYKVKANPQELYIIVYKD